MGATANPPAPQPRTITALVHRGTQFYNSANSTRYGVIVAQGQLHPIHCFATPSGASGPPNATLPLHVSSASTNFNDGCSTNP